MYRRHCTQQDNAFVKDLSKLGRDLNRTIIIDNSYKNFALQPDNGIYITSFYEDENDLELQEMTELLVHIAKSQCPDVKVVLRKYRDMMVRNIYLGIAEPHKKITFLDNKP